MIPNPFKKPAALSQREEAVRNAQDALQAEEKRVRELHENYAALTTRRDALAFGLNQAVSKEEMLRERLDANGPFIADQLFSNAPVDILFNAAVLRAGLEILAKSVPALITERRAELARATAAVEAFKKEHGASE